MNTDMLEGRILAYAADCGGKMRSREIIRRLGIDDPDELPIGIYAACRRLVAAGKLTPHYGPQGKRVTAYSLAKPARDPLAGASPGRLVPPAPSAEPRGLLRRIAEALGIAQ